MIHSGHLQPPSGGATGPQAHACDGIRHGVRGPGRRAFREPRLPRSVSQQQALQAPTVPAPGSSSTACLQRCGRTKQSSATDTHTTPHPPPPKHGRPRRPGRALRGATWIGTRGRSAVRLHAVPASAYHQSSASWRGAFSMSQSSPCTRRRPAARAIRSSATGSVVLELGV